MVVRPQHRRRLAAARTPRRSATSTRRAEIEPIARKGRAASKAMARLALMLGDYEGAARFARDRVTPP